MKQNLIVAGLMLVTSTIGSNFAVAQTRNHDLVFMHHTGTSLTNAEADRIAADATAVLKTDSGNNDIACDVNVGRRGNVGSFSVTDGIIDNATEFVQVEQVSGDVKIVRAINWCGSIGAGIIGCARVPGSSLAMVRFNRSLEGILLAHEFGHNQGLSHRNGTDNLMHPSIGASRVGLNQAECTAFRGPARIHAFPSASVFNAQHTADSPVLEIIKQHYFHGFPVDVGLGLPPEAAGEIAALLSDEDQKEWWPNALAALGLIGGEDSFELITTFIEETAVGRTDDPDVFRALATAPIALGYYANVSADRDAVAYLAAGATPERLNRDSRFQSLSSEEPDSGLGLAGSFIAGLSLAVTSDNEALNALNDLSTEEGGFQAIITDRSNDAAREYLRVQEMGLEAYSSQ